MEENDDDDIFSLKAAEEFVAKQSTQAPSTPSSCPNPNPLPSGAVGTYFSSTDSISIMGNSAITRLNFETQRDSTRNTE